MRNLIAERIVRNRKAKVGRFRKNTAGNGRFENRNAERLRMVRQVFNLQKMRFARLFDRDRIGFPSQIVRIFRRVELDKGLLTRVLRRERFEVAASERMLPETIPLPPRAAKRQRFDPRLKFAKPPELQKIGRKRIAEKRHGRFPRHLTAYRRGGWGLSRSGGRGGLMNGKRILQRGDQFRVGKKRTPGENFPPGRIRRIDRFEQAFAQIKPIRLLRRDRSIFPIARNHDPLNHPLGQRRRFPRRAAGRKDRKAIFRRNRLREFDRKVERPLNTGKRNRQVEPGARRVRTFRQINPARPERFLPPRRTNRQLQPTFSLV